MANLFGSTHRLQPNASYTTVKHNKLSEPDKTFANSLQKAGEVRDIDSVLEVATLVDEYFAQKRGALRR
ncbi:hypothetical protein OAF56_03500 [Pirellulaceae bacterium]|jgi:hypothetical protein|nr:hypothetical protein [Pirellulaceae bacterium]